MANWWAASGCYFVSSKEKKKKVNLFLFRFFISFNWIIDDFMVIKKDILNQAWH